MTTVWIFCGLLCFLDHVFDDKLVHICHAWGCHLWSRVSGALLSAHSLQWLRMLGRDDHSVDLLRLHSTISFLQVLNRDLSLAVRTQPPQLAILTHICQLFA